MTRFIYALTLTLFMTVPVFAQDDNPFLLERGDDDFGFWAGFSNGDRAGSNRGLNQFVIYAGFSVFR